MPVKSTRVVIYLKGVRRFFRIISWILNLLLVIGVVAVCLIGYHFYQKYYPVFEQYYDYAVDVVKKSSENDFMSAQTSYLFDVNGDLLAELKSERDANYVEFSEFPDVLIQATIAIEDKRFYEHEGVDWLSTAKAATLYLNDSSNIVRGGSTLTQQLVKNIYLTSEKSLERKGKEILIALQLEKKYGKEQILEYYLNNINYSNGFYGIGAASKGYFNKDVSELSLTEAAFLVAIPNNPTLYNPFQRIENTIRRRNIILKEMWEQGYISEKEYWTASNQVIQFVSKKVTGYNYDVSYAVDCAVRILMENNDFKFRYTFNSMKDFKKYQKKYQQVYQEMRDELYVGGYSVYTTINPDIQKMVQKELDTTLKGFKKKVDGIYEVQGAVTVIDNLSGYVTAIVGGRSQKINNAFTLNRAYQGYKQPGSTIKPLIVYTPAFDSGYTPDSLVKDEAIADGPKNSNNVYDGEITLREAVARSKNVVAWQLFKSLGIQESLKYVQDMQFSRIVPDDYYLPAALGGLTYGVTTVEMASGYATLANDGVFREPTCVSGIKDRNGKDILLVRDKHRVYSVEASRVMTDVLQDVAEKGTASGLDIGGMPIACKTGTTNGQTCGWFCGYTPYYSVACYVGKDYASKVSNLWGSTYPMYLWKGIQSNLNSELEIIKFQEPEKYKHEKDNKEEVEKKEEIEEEKTVIVDEKIEEREEYEKEEYEKEEIKDEQTDTNFELELLPTEQESPATEYESSFKEPEFTESESSSEVTEELEDGDMELWFIEEE